MTACVTRVTCMPTLKIQFVKFYVTSFVIANLSVGLNARQLLLWMLKVGVLCRAVCS